MSQERTSWKESIRAIATLSASWLLLGLPAAAERPDGAYLADVEVVIEDAKGESLPETTTRGPVLLAGLPPGRYTLHASATGHASERRMIDVPKERDPVRLYVALPETSDPRGQSHGEERGEEREAERREGEGPSKTSQSKSQPQP